MMNYENPDFEGNSEKYHTGKKCTVKGCDHPAGTWWSPFFCFEHNVERLKRITAGLDEAVKKAEVQALVDEATASLRGWASDMSRTMKAMVLASGGDLTITNADKDAALASESIQYGEHTTSYHYRRAKTAR